MSKKNTLIVLLVSLVLIIAGYVYFVGHHLQPTKTFVNTTQTNTTLLPSPAACSKTTIYTNLLTAASATPSTICALNLQGQHIPSTLGLFTQFTNLKQLNLSYNEITNVSPDIGQINSLVILDLSNNGIPSLPSGLGGLNNLSKLSLANNNLSDLPSDLSGLTSLMQLNLSNNQFASLPSVVTSMPSLVELNINNNPIKTLPDLSGLKHLSFLDIVGTKIPASAIPALQKQLPNTKIIAK